jgi:DNA-binding NtrC family response regulator
MRIASHLKNRRFNMDGTVLIIDDDFETASLYQTAFESEDFRAKYVTGLAEAKALLINEQIQVVLADIFLMDENTLSELKSMIQLSPSTRFFSFSGQESIPLAVKAMELGAASFFPKSLGCHKIVELIKNKFEMDTQPIDDVSQGFLTSINLVGESDCMQKLFHQIKTYSQVNSTVLITGESGTGKEVVAKALHKLSPLSEGPFEAVNCGAIPETLLESELFGHKRGAFTDAKTDKKGLFEACSNGTLMLDEIGDMPLPLQVKLLRVLQEREVRPLGSTKTVKVNPRIIACTHRDLNKMVAEGQFRKDLLFRLSVLHLSIPPLRERKKDIDRLTNIFIEQFNTRFKRSITPISNELLVRLMNYDWPGNIRELQNMLERAVVLSKDSELHIEDLFSNDIVSEEESSHDDSISLTHKTAKRNFEKRYIRHLLEESHGNISQASRLSGKHRIELYRLMEKYGYRREEFIEKSS